MMIMIQIPKEDIENHLTSEWRWGKMILLLNEDNGKIAQIRNEDIQEKGSTEKWRYQKIILLLNREIEKKFY